MGKNIEGMAPREPSGKDASADDFLNGSTGDDSADSGSTADSGDIDVSEDDPGIIEVDGELRRRMTVYMNPEDGKRVKVLAALQNRPASEVLEEAVTEYLDDQDLPDL